MITIEIMTRELCNKLYRDFQNDPCIYEDMAKFAPFTYQEAWVNAYFDRQAAKQRIYFAVMLDGQPIGEVLLKQINQENRSCVLGIHLQNDTVKGKGYGTCAETLAIEYAFDRLGLATVYADAVRKNTRSQHVLEKVGFRFIREDETFRYYKIERSEVKNSPTKLHQLTNDCPAF